jgi:uncharacterized membrane protein YhaH (DUF805 family)
MNFTEVISSGFRNYVNFTGRAARSEFRFWFLFSVLASIVAGIIDYALFGGEVLARVLSPISGLVSLALFLPGLAVSVRRADAFMMPPSSNAWCVANAHEGD